MNRNFVYLITVMLSMLVLKGSETRMKVSVACTIKLFQRKLWICLVEYRHAIYQNAQIVTSHTALLILVDNEREHLNSHGTHFKRPSGYCLPEEQKC